MPQTAHNTVRDSARQQGAVAKLELEGLPPVEKAVLTSAIEAGFSLGRVDAPAPGFEVKLNNKRVGYFPTPGAAVRLEEAALNPLREHNVARLTNKFYQELANLDEPPGSENFVSDEKVKQIKTEFARALGLPPEAAVKIGCSLTAGRVAVALFHADPRHEEAIASFVYIKGGTSVTSLRVEDNLRGMQDLGPKQEVLAGLAHKHQMDIYHAHAVNTPASDRPSPEKMAQILEEFDTALGLKKGTLTDISLSDSARGDMALLFHSGQNILGRYYQRWLPRDGQEKISLDLDVSASEVPFNALYGKVCRLLELSAEKGENNQFTMRTKKDGGDFLVTMAKEGKLLATVRFRADSQTDVEITRP